MENNEVALGLIVDLSYKNPHLSPFHEFQRWKHHPLVAETLEGGKRIAYGARAIVKGGIQALPKLSVPGAVLVGDDAGFLNVLKIKGSHTAMKSGMLAAEPSTPTSARPTSPPGSCRSSAQAFEKSWLFEELQRSRNVGPALHKFGVLGGSAYAFLDQFLLRGSAPYTLSDPTPDHATLKLASEAKPIDYPKPDGVLSFDKLSSVFLSNTNHEEDQPCHLQLKDPSIPISRTCRSTTSRPSATAPQPSTRWWRKTAASVSRSTRRTACTARPATSRTRRRTSTGWCRRAAAGRTTRTCDAGWLVSSDGRSGVRVPPLPSQAQRPANRVCDPIRESAARPHPGSRRSTTPPLPPSSIALQSHGGGAVAGTAIRQECAARNARSRRSSLPRRLEPREAN
jgi:hypothetical protein